MGVFFAGRLWISPATMSVVDDTAMANQNLSVGNVLVLIGRSSGGEPNKALRFGSPQQAIATLRDGELLEAVKRAFDPSAQTNGPSLVIAVRVNPAVQSGLSLLDASNNPVISLKSTDYGLYTNQIKVKVESGSTAGKKVTTQFGNAYYTADNISRSAFRVQYTGAAATAVMDVTNSQITLQAPTGTTVATIDLDSFPSVEQVVDRINSVTGFTASVEDGNGQKPALNGLDTVTAQDVKTAPYVATAHLQAIVDWLNGTSEGFVTATRAVNAGTVPANIPFTYMTGGSDGIVTNSEWGDAYATLQTVDAQWVVPVSSDPSIHAMNDTHCAFMSNVARMERRGIVGMASGSTDDQALAAAKALNSDRTSLIHLGFYDYNPAGKLVLFPPYIAAALVAGAFSGVNPGTPLTNKTVKVRGLERDLRNPTDTDVLIEGGVLCLENTPNGYKVVKSITTWLANDNYNRVEVSVGAAADFVARNVRDAVDILRGEKASPISMSRAVSITESTLRELARPEPQGPGVIVGDEASPAYRNIKAELEGDVLRIEFECSPVLPINYIPITIFAVPYSGTATAA
ncbi:major tail sheath [Bordetella phage vB_BbrM_PHB04]|uniref:Major tail sheath n=1 Tax=Bordetella phage vB_BbrM_PHB04 TaxID=2029657 RepID=A0A291L9V9_9CAUD|nr:tail sheath [Bordetella phage vB_BbrM_PHB04]ATI15630.1 major tail sheath [Bordetella phage vB_BbrM_PHB04]